MRKKVLREVEARLRQYRDLKKRADPQAAAWCAAIEQTMTEYDDTGEPARVRLLVLRYFEEEKEETVMETICVARNTYYTWKREALMTIAFHAAQSGLFPPEKRKITDSPTKKIAKSRDNRA